MKYSIYIMMLMSLFLYGCSQDELIAEQEEAQEVYTVSLKFNGDIQTEESPLSRTEVDEVYGIQVYNGDAYFASGVFSSKDNISINLLAGGVYRFVCTAIKDSERIVIQSDELPFMYAGKERVYRPQYKDYRYYYNDLFWGDFKYVSSSTWALTSLNSSKVTIPDEGGRICYKVDRFYGELANYTPSVNGIVNLELKRVSFGVKLKVSNITDGNVSVKCYNDYNTFVEVSGLTSDYESAGEIFSMANVYDAWQYASSYTEDIKLDVVWNRGVGVTQSWTKTFQVKRNAMNTIRVKLGEDEYDSGVGVTPEGGDMGSEEEEIPLG